MQANFTSVKVMAVAILVFSSFFAANAQSKKGTSTPKTSQNVVPTPTKSTSSIPTSRPSSSQNLVPQSSFRKGSKYLGRRCKFSW